VAQLAILSPIIMGWSGRSWVQDPLGVCNLSIIIIIGLGRFGVWSLFVFSGVSGGQETLDVLRGWRGMCWS
jgi:hypothetical protein